MVGRVDVAAEESGPKESPGAKARILLSAFTARLKSCPDTKHQSRDSGKTPAFRRFESIARPKTNVPWKCDSDSPSRPDDVRVDVRAEESGPKESPEAKARILLGAFTARLKSCPDTKHQSRDSGKTHAFRRFASIARPRTNVPWKCDSHSPSRPDDVRAEARTYQPVTYQPVPTSPYLPFR
jgi:hypothetical protein